MTATSQLITAMILYLIMLIIFGLWYARKAQESSENYFLGGRGLGPWVAAMSAEASDMSGWLLMGLPGVAYWLGLADAAWTAIGLLLGTYLNWLIVSKPLRRYSTLTNSITIPEFFSHRFHESGKKPLLVISSLFILIFFSVYAASCFVTSGKLFSQLFNTDYTLMMLLGAVIVVFYTLLGGFLAESVSDMVQAVIMIIALVSVLSVGIVSVGGFGVFWDNVQSIPGFMSFFGMASPVTEGGVQEVFHGVPQFGAMAPYGILTIVSTMAWGLGYFGMPQVLLRFFAIRKASDLTRSRRIATIWCIISLSAAVFIGLVGRSLFPVHESLLTSGGAENVFVVIASTLFNPFLAGIMMSGILAAAMSSSDSYLLIASSALAKDIYAGIIKKNATDKQVMLISRITVIAMSVIGVIIALDENSKIFTIVSFAWAGFGATFGPLVLFSLFWKKLTHAGAVCGMLGGAGMVFLWKLAIRPLGGVFGIYELLPAFIFSALLIVIISLISKKPDDEIVKEFEKARTFEC